MPRGFGGGGFRGGGFGMRRGGMPLLGEMGMGMGSPLLTGLMTGGIGYLLGSNSANQQASQQVQQVAPQSYQQSQQPQQPQWTQAPTAPLNSDVLAQLKLLGDLHESGVLTDVEFTNEKYRILGR